MTVTGFSDYGSVYTTFDDENAFEIARKAAGRTPSSGRKENEYSFSKYYIDLCIPVVIDLSEMV